MASFKRDNGKRGIEMAYHTTTGYECYANYTGHDRINDMRIKFYTRHVVGSDGRPYTEIGLTGIEDDERTDALKAVKAKLADTGFVEVSCLMEAGEVNKAFTEHTTPEHDAIAFRVNAGDDGISVIIDAIGNMVLDSSRRFVKSQEKVPDVLYESIMYFMGDDLDKSPGGHEHAVEKAHELADELLHGFESQGLQEVLY